MQYFIASLSFILLSNYYGSYRPLPGKKIKIGIALTIKLVTLVLIKKKKLKVLRLSFILLLLPIFSKSQVADHGASAYPKMVGDIIFNPVTDKAGFDICNEKNIFQYFNTGGGLQYEGEKVAIEKIFKEKYRSTNVKKESGMIRIRFVVNCKGETDRFRIIASDDNYNEKIFDPSITNQLLAITKMLNGWKTKTLNGNKIDYYQYLIFKITDGRLKEILP